MPRLCPVKTYINRQLAVGHSLPTSALSNRKLSEVYKA